jgi:hypothetical protein
MGGAPVVVRRAMRAQVDHLAEMAQRPNVLIQVIRSKSARMRASTGRS